MDLKVLSLNRCEGMVGWGLDEVELLLDVIKELWGEAF